MFIFLSINLGEDDQGYPVVCVGGGPGLPVRSHHLRWSHLGPQVHQLFELFFCGNGKQIISFSGGFFGRGGWGVHIES